MVHRIKKAKKRIPWVARFWQVHVGSSTQLGSLRRGGGNSMVQSYIKPICTCWIWSKADTKWLKFWCRVCLLHHVSCWFNRSCWDCKFKCMPISIRKWCHLHEGSQGLHALKISQWSTWWGLGFHTLHYTSHTISQKHNTKIYVPVCSALP